MALSGNIYWVSDEFNNGMRVDVYHNTANINNIVIKSESNGDDLIEFIIPFNSNFKRRYDIKLIKKNDTLIYKSDRKDLEFSCSLFENKNIIMIFGDRFEDDEKFMCWVIINKINSN